MLKRIRNRLVHSFFDAGTKKHQIFIYDKQYNVVAHLMVSPTGDIEILRGKLK